MLFTTFAALTQQIADLFPVRRESSWLYFTQGLRDEIEDQSVIVKRLPTIDISPFTSGGGGQPQVDFLPSMQLADSSQTAGPLQSATGYAGNPAMPADQVQYRAAPTYTVWYYGQALRAGFEIIEPTLVSVGGVPALPARRRDRGEGFSMGLVARWGGGIMPVYGAVWNLRYILPVPPTGPFALPASPL